jgi:hypothetical protein
LEHHLSASRSYWIREVAIFSYRVLGQEAV